MPLIVALVDTNVLVHAADRRSRHHEAVFREQRATGTCQIWAEPFVELRVPKMDQHFFWVAMNASVERTKAPGMTYDIKRKKYAFPSQRC